MCPGRGTRLSYPSTYPRFDPLLHLKMECRKSLDSPLGDILLLSFPFCPGAEFSPGRKVDMVP